MKTKWIVWICAFVVCCVISGLLAYWTNEEQGQAMPIIGLAFYLFVFMASTGLALFAAMIVLTEWLQR